MGFCALGRVLGLEQRDSTRLRIFECIRAAGQISRIDIANILQMSPATVTAATADFLAAGLIVETSTSGSADGGRRGRPRVNLKLNEEAHLVAGIKVARTEISVLVADFVGAETISHDMPLADAQMHPEKLVQNIRQALDETCEKGGISVDRISGASIGIAGLVDAEKNFVHWSSSLKGRNHDLGGYLSKHLPFPAFIENDANLVAKAEQLFGEGRDLTNFLVITFEHGIGLGIVLGGELYRGERGCGAEFGHMKVHLDGALCQCGQRGCLEAYVGAYALLREAAISSPGNEPRSVTDIFEAARDGSPVAQSVLERAGQMFGMGVANLINLFDPQRIILSGGNTSLDHMHTDSVRARIRRDVLNVDAPIPEIVVNRWGHQMWARGAAAHAIEQVSRLKVVELAANAD